MFKELYDLSKRPSFHNELKEKLESIQSHLTMTENSPLPDPITEAREQEQ